MLVGASLPLGTDLSNHCSDDNCSHEVRHGSRARRRGGERAGNACGSWRARRHTGTAAGRTRTQSTMIARTHGLRSSRVLSILMLQRNCPRHFPDVSPRRCWGASPARDHKLAGTPNPKPQTLHPKPQLTSTPCGLSAGSAPSLLLGAGRDLHSVFTRNDVQTPHAIIKGSLAPLSPVFAHPSAFCLQSIPRQNLHERPDCLDRDTCQRE
jgi:hypothetical protein